MGVNITIVGSDRNSDEYKAAVQLKNIIQRDLPDKCFGEIVLFAGATLFGQAVKDIDIFMLGMLNNYDIDAEFYEKTQDETAKKIKANVNIQNFCTVIEVKRHDISGIIRKGTDFYVKYGNHMHCVTLQSNNQKLSARSFFENTLTFSPFITNLIWFTQVTEGDIRQLLTEKRGRIISNVLGRAFHFKDLVRLLIFQYKPYKKNGMYFFDPFYGAGNLKTLQDALQLFSRTKQHMGELTRKRIELITNQDFCKNYIIDGNGKISIYRGRAGTGKTVGLIQIAIKLVDEYQARVVILTYNRALVADIRRLFALTELPDMFEEKCVCVTTMQSYFYNIANTLLYDGKLEGKRFLDDYDVIICELNEFLSDDTTLEVSREILELDCRLDWEYVLIDEAQDWTNGERDLILKLFEQGKIVVADGGNQFVRRGAVCDWSVIHERNNIKLKYCLRQKENIISFLNAFTRMMGLPGGKILANNKMQGGKVLVVQDDNLMQIHRAEMKRLLEVGNIAYDMLYLVPHALVETKEDGACFLLKNKFEQEGIFFWDGTNANNRKNYPMQTDEVRILQYDSSRGLEGWIVVCMDFDIFLEEKMREYIEEPVDSLLLESPEEKRKKYLYNWAMMPLTRAIDTLVITLKHPESEIANILKEISNQYEDYVIWME